MKIADNTRTLFLALILATLSIGYTFAHQNVVVVPLAGDNKTGISGYEIVTINGSLSVGEAGVNVNCPTGKRVLGGGGAEFGDLVMIDSYPSGDNSWVVTWAKRVGGGTNPVDFDVYAICAEVS